MFNLPRQPAIKQTRCWRSLLYHHFFSSSSFWSLLASKKLSPASFLSLSASSFCSFNSLLHVSIAFWYLDTSSRRLFTLPYSITPKAIEITVIIIRTNLIITEFFILNIIVVNRLLHYSKYNFLQTHTTSRFRYSPHEYNLSHIQ